MSVRFSRLSVRERKLLARLLEEALADGRLDEYDVHRAQNLLREIRAVLRDEALPQPAERHLYRDEGGVLWATS